MLLLSAYETKVGSQQGYRLKWENTEKRLKCTLVWIVSYKTFKGWGSELGLW